VKKQEIENIISKQLIEGLDKREQAIFDEWLAQSEENQKEYKAYSRLWEKSKKLVVSDQIDTEYSLKRTKQKINFSTKKRWIIYARQAVAVVVLSIAISFLYTYLNKEEQSVIAEQQVYQEIKASYGTQTKVILADGTTVWLNSGSTLRFPSSFKNSSERNVEINGEGYFEVTENKLKPFVVETPKLDIRVLGTSFNVSAYNEYNLMTVALVKGEISLERNFGDERKELITLEPNELVEYDSNNKKLYHSSSTYIEKHTAWKEGQIVFFNDPIEVVVRRLEKWYNVKISVSDKTLQDYSFTATFIDESLEQVLKLLSLSSPMNYKITPAKKQKDNSYSMREITLSLKK